MKPRILLIATLAITLPTLMGLKTTPNEVEPETLNKRETMYTYEAHSVKPICFTRFQIDVPMDAEVVFGRMTVNAEIDRYVSQAGNFDALVAEAIERNGENAKMFIDSSPIDQLAEKPLDSAVHGLKHVINKTGYNSYRVHSFLLLGDDVFRLEGTGLPGTWVMAKLARHEEVARGLRSRGDSEIPNEEGICIDGAFTQQVPDYENIQLGVRLNNHPDVHFSVQLIKNRDYLEQEGNFQKRLAHQAQNAVELGHADWFSKIKYLRKGARDVGGWSGYEVAAHLPEGHGAKEAHQFLFHSRGKKDDPLHPQVDIQLDTGVLNNKTQSTRPSLTDDEAVELWDHLLSSIRVRSIAPLKPTVPTPGLTLSEGELSPVDGWWECLSVDGYPPEIEVHGGKIQHFHRRVALPRVTLSRPSGFWQRLTGRPRTFQPSEKSSWRLIKIEADTSQN